MGNQIGRNDPCPCCSGKKYKKCCSGKDDLVGMEVATRADMERFLYPNMTCFVCNKPANVFATSGIGAEDFEPDGVIVNWDGRRLSCHGNCMKQAEEIMQQRGGSIVQRRCFE